MPSEKCLTLEAKLCIHIYLHSFQGCTDFTDGIITRCTPPFFHNSQVAFCPGLPDSLVSSPVISKSAFRLSDSERPLPVLPLCIFQSRLPCLFPDAFNFHPGMLFSEVRHYAVIIPGICLCLPLCKTDAGPDQPCQFINRMPLPHFLCEKRCNSVLLLLCAYCDKIGTTLFEPVEYAGCLHIKLKSKAVEDWLSFRSCLYCFRPHTAQSFSCQYGVILPPQFKRFGGKAAVKHRLPEFLVGDCVLLILPEAAQDFNRIVTLIRQILFKPS